MAEELLLPVALETYAQLLIDTCVLIDEFRRPTGRLGGINRAQRATSIVSVWEFLHGTRGALLGRLEREERRRWLHDQGIARLRLSPDCSLSFEALLRTEGPPSVADSLLAAECLARRIPVVKRNVADFSNVRGLRYVRW
jgi:predicted nucleic acid-binding protein